MISISELLIPVIMPHPLTPSPLLSFPSPLQRTDGYAGAPAAFRRLRDRVLASPITFEEVGVGVQADGAKVAAFVVCRWAGGTEFRKEARWALGIRDEPSCDFSHQYTLCTMCKERGTGSGQLKLKRLRRQADLSCKADHVCAFFHPLR